MFKLTHPLPKKCLVAVSGGMDSMAAFHWLNRVPGRVAGVVHFNHKTGDFSDRAAQFVAEEAKELHLPFYIDILNESVAGGEGPEAFWREHRYAFLDRIAEIVCLPIVLAHQLDDCVEEYLICTLKRGYTGTIQYQRGDCIRPFRLWKRELIHKYVMEEGINFIDDPMNRDVTYLRSYVRYELMPKVLQVNPGIYGMVERLILKDQ